MRTTYVAELAVVMKTETCCVCGMVFAMTEEHYKRLRNMPMNTGSFYCPSGHAQHYTGEKEVDRLRRELEAAQKYSENLRAARNAAQEQASHEAIERKKLRTRMKSLRTRVKNGACPCCNRQFENLRNHMANEHPEYSSEPEGTK